MWKKTQLVVAFLFCASSAFAGLSFGPEQLVQANGVDIDVTGYSVPSFSYWNDDNLKDLIIGEGGGLTAGKVRVYLNSGTQSAPQFTTWFYAQSSGADLTCPASGCLGCFPRVAYWDVDDRKDLVVGRSDGKIMLFLNNGTDAAPAFDAGTLLQVGPSGSKTDIDVGSRATSSVVDWNSDGKKDLIAGAIDGKIHIFINEGTDGSPDFQTKIVAQAYGADLVVPGLRSSPVAVDLNGDGNKDLLAGDTYGRLAFYSNTGSDTSPTFGDYQYVQSEGIEIDLDGYPRSRPFVCDWTGDGYLDILVGAEDGRIHLYQGLPEPGTVLLLALGATAMLRRRR